MYERRIMKPMEHQRAQFVVSTDRARLDLDVIHVFLSHGYWAEGIPRDVVARSIENSLCFGVFDGRKQIGFARVITDYATYAYLGDVFILEPYRGMGLGKFLNGVHCAASPVTRASAVDISHARRAQPVCAIRIQAAGPSRAIHGAT